MNRNNQVPEKPTRVNAYLARCAQAGSRCLGKEAKALQVHLEISAEFYLYRFHPLVHWVHRLSYWPVGVGKKMNKMQKLVTSE